MLLRKTALKDKFIGIFIYLQYNFKEIFVMENVQLNF